MIVIAHRPPLKRIDLGASKPRAPEPEEPEGIRALRELGARLEQERIWRTIVRASQGQGNAHETTAVSQD